MTVEHWLNRWFAAKTDPASDEEPLRASTAVSYKTHINRCLLPYLGALKLGDLRPTHIAEMIATIRKKRGAVIAEAQAKKEQYREEAEEINARRR